MYAFAAKAVCVAEHELEIFKEKFSSQFVILYEKWNYYVPVSVPDVRDINRLLRRVQDELRGDGVFTGGNVLTASSAI